MNNMLRVNESFASIQGEGFYTGIPCYFIRLQGCDVKCSFCDSKDTWDLNGGVLMTFQEILDQIPDGIYRIVITGGEPTLHNNLPDLVKFLGSKGYRVHIETSGIHYDILKRLYNPTWVWWVTISPKQVIPTTEVLILADEIKWIIQTEQDLWQLDEVWEKLEELVDNPPLFYLQPVSCEKEATDLCVQHVLANAGRDYRLSIQIQNYIGVR